MKTAIDLIFFLISLVGAFILGVSITYKDWRSATTVELSLLMAHKQECKQIATREQECILVYEYTPALKSPENE